MTFLTVFWSGNANIILVLEARNSSTPVLFNKYLEQNNNDNNDNNNDDYDDNNDINDDN